MRNRVAWVAINFSSRLYIWFNAGNLYYYALLAYMCFILLYQMLMLVYLHIHYKTLVLHSKLLGRCFFYQSSVFTPSVSSSLLQPHQTSITLSVYRSISLQPLPLCYHTKTCVLMIAPGLIIPAAIILRAAWLFHHTPMQSAFFMFE